LGGACFKPKLKTQNQTKNMEANKKWYAVYTRPRWEKKVAELLVKKHIESYCPLNKIVRQWADRKKLVQEPLFTSYVFVHTTPQEHLTIKQTDGILNFVYWLGQPAVIRDEEIDAVKQFLDEYHNVQLEKIHVNMHDRVRISSGPLMAREGDVIEVRSKTVKVQLPTLGYALTAEVEKTNVEVIPIVPSYSNNYFYNALFK
jgi:transcription antitermination factor NusG